jgi:steroid 5-alpha reductase family enzyme
VAWFTFIQSDGYIGRKLLVSLLTTLWGARLAIHIFVRNRGKGEDPRYKAMRAKHGERFWWVSLLTVFMLQAVLLWVISLVVQVSLISPLPKKLVWLDVAGIIIWTVGFTFEAVGDWQLTRFVRNPANKGEIMNSGLWGYTRHPNYFGESLIWWGMFLFALATPRSVWVVISPLLITFLLLRVSGVTLLEESMLSSHPEYQDYVRNTSAFIPWFPKKGRRNVR